MKKLLFLLLAVVLVTSMCLVGVGCKTTSATESAETTVATEITEAEETTAAETTAVAETLTTEPVDISFWVNSGDMDAGWHNEMIGMFTKEHPNVSFKVTPMASADIWQLAPSAVASGAEELDLIWIEATDSVQSLMAQKGLLLDLTPYYDKYDWWSQVNKEYIDSTKTQGGGQFFFPTSWVSYPYFFYNTEIFKEVGVEVPKNLDELISICKKIRDAGYQPVATGLDWEAERFEENLFLRFIKGDDWNNFLFWYKDDTISPEVLKSSGVVESFAYLEKMVKEGVFQEGFGVVDDATCRSMLEDGKAAMYTSGNWTAGLLDQEAPELKYDIFPFPENNGDTRIIVYHNNSLCIPANVPEEKIPVIIEYLNKTISSEYAITAYKHGQISASKNLTSEQIAEVASPMTTKAVDLAMKSGGGLWYGIWWPAPMWDAALQSMNNIINGTWTPEEAANHLYETGISELEQKQQ